MFCRKRWIGEGCRVKIRTGTPVGILMGSTCRHKDSTCVIPSGIHKATTNTHLLDKLNLVKLIANIEPFKCQCVGNFDVDILALPPF